MSYARHPVAASTGPDTSHAAVVASCTCGFTRVCETPAQAVAAGETHGALHRLLARRDAIVSACPHPVSEAGGRPGGVPDGSFPSSGSLAGRSAQASCAPQTPQVRRMLE
jgi:hypothetical protein